MSVATYRPWGQTEGKIRPEHQDRTAVVYLLTELRKSRPS